MENGKSPRDIREIERFLDGSHPLFQRRNAQPHDARGLPRIRANPAGPR